ncbi:MAG: shikimate dehydrogenase [Acidobacteria bacterium]|nr:shikimate dehydrogenase [Acidobacteriota bacterium]
MGELGVGVAAMHLVLLGDPVEHSRSPAIHQAALRALGLTGTYVARRTDGDGVVAACVEIRDGALGGANVTMPLKKAALVAVDAASEPARRAGAVNTLCFRSGAVFGENTDIGGFSDVWEHRGLPDDAPILVLGAGGAAAAVMLAREGSEILASSRRRGAVTELASQLGVTVSEVPWGVAVVGAVVVNATPLGMAGELLPEGIVDAAVGLFDLAYGADTTPAVAEAGQRPVADGIDMLVAQAARSFEMWTGRRAPLEVMETAARGRSTSA